MEGISIISIFLCLFWASVVYVLWPEDLIQGSFRPLRVIRSITVFPGKQRVHELKIRKIDIHKIVQQIQRLRQLITAAVVKHRYRKASFPRQSQRLCTLRYKMRCSDKINIVCASFLLCKKDIRKLFLRYLCPSPARCDRVILAKTASQ